MANDLAGMTSQFATNDVTPRTTSGSALNDMLVNSTGMSQNPSDPRMGPMQVNPMGGGPGDAYTRASEQLAELARKTMLVGLAKESAIIAQRLASGEYGSDAQAKSGAEARMDQINAQTGYAQGYRGAIEIK